MRCNTIAARIKQCRQCKAPMFSRFSAKGPDRAYCSQSCARVAKKNKSKTTERTFKCERCGNLFCATGYAKRYCSKECGYQIDEMSFGRKSTCKQCGCEYTRKSRKQQYCSVECGHKPELHRCLNCGSDFAVKNRSRHSHKFCSRECAFEARRLKKECASRPVYAYKSLARWFHAWGDDRWPMTAKCVSCGSFFDKRSESGDDSCGKCRACLDCGAVIKEKYSRRCKRCKKKADDLASERSRHLSKARKRCRHYGVPYRAFSRAKIFQRDRWRCQICGERLLKKFEVLPVTGSPHPRSPTIDHIIPLSMRERSPGHCESNVQACCWDCNVRKGNNESYTPALRKDTLLH